MVLTPIIARRAATRRKDLDAVPSLREALRHLEHVLLGSADEIGTEPRNDERRRVQGRYPSTA
jgi:hypothetical protein